MLSSLLVNSKTQTLAQINGRATVHTKYTAQVQLTPGVPEILGIRKQCGLPFDVALFGQEQRTMRSVPSEIGCFWFKYLRHFCYRCFLLKPPERCRRFWIARRMD